MALGMHPANLYPRRNRFAPTVIVWTVDPRRHPPRQNDRFSLEPLPSRVKPLERLDLAAGACILTSVIPGPDNREDSAGARREGTIGLS